MEYLNLYAGVNGNTELITGVNITHVENNPEIAQVIKDRKPGDKVIIEDAHEYLRLHSDDFDFIWSSKPCQSHTRMMKFTRHKLKRFPDFGLYEEIVFLQNFYKGLWVVENVIPYYKPLIEPTARIGRHIFWSNFYIPQMTNEPVSPPDMMNTTTVAKKKIMMDWLGIHYDKNIYYNGNHCPVQVLRNCVHPLIGKHVFDAAMISRAD